MNNQESVEMLEQMIETSANGTMSGPFGDPSVVHEVPLPTNPPEEYYRVSEGSEKLAGLEDILSTQEKYYRAPREPDRRRVAPQDRKRFEVDKMWELHHEIVRRTVLGQSNIDIARSLNVSEVMVSYTLNSEVCKKKVALMRAERDRETINIAKEIRDFAIEPLEFLKDIIRNKGDKGSVSLAAKTSENWLDRAGYGATKKIEAVVAHLTAEEIEQIKSDAKTDAIASGTIIDTQAEVIKNQEEIIKNQKEGSDEKSEVRGSQKVY